MLRRGPKVRWCSTLIPASTRIEVSAASGTGQLQLAGGTSGAAEESVRRAVSCQSAEQSDLEVAGKLDASDLHVQAVDVLHNKDESGPGIGFSWPSYRLFEMRPCCQERCSLKA